MRACVCVCVCANRSMRSGRQDPLSPHLPWISPLTPSPSNYVWRPCLAEPPDISVCVSAVAILNQQLIYDKIQLPLNTILRLFVSRRKTEEGTKRSRKACVYEWDWASVWERESIHPLPAEFTLIYWGQCGNHLIQAVIGQTPDKQNWPSAHTLKRAHTVKRLMCYLCCLVIICVWYLYRRASCFLFHSHTCTARREKCVRLCLCALWTQKYQQRSDFWFCLILSSPRLWTAKPTLCYRDKHTHTLTPH